MEAEGWRSGVLWEIPSRSELPGFSADEYQQSLAERAPHILQRWADAGERFRHEHRKAHDIRGYLGIKSFGANAFEAHEGELLVVPHDELGDGEGQEELYVVVAGRARFVCDDDELILNAGSYVYAPPGVRREAVALATPTLLLIIGGRQGKPYSPPIWATDWHAPVSGR